MPKAGNRRHAGSAQCRVLLVEDDDTFAAALTELLHADGRIDVVGRARHGREGVELADELEPDVVLMDIELPIMDGVAATRAIRGKHPDMPVVALTGWEYEERALEVLEAGAVDFLRKGRLDTDLTETVVSIAGRQTAGAHAPNRRA